jgi:hypothetical protein
VSCSGGVVGCVQPVRRRILIHPKKNNFFICEGVLRGKKCIERVRFQYEKSIEKGIYWCKECGKFCSLVQKNFLERKDFSFFKLLNREIDTINRCFNFIS